MQQIREGADQPPGRRRPARRPVRIPDEQRAELYALLNDYTQALDERLDDGLRGLQRAAQQLMRQLAAEVWRAGGPTAGKNLRENVIAALAHDDTIKGLLAHTDERFQSLKVRLAEMEAAVRQLAEATRDAVHRVNQRAQAIDRALAQPTSPEAMQRLVGPLAQRVDQLGRALAPMTEGMQRLEVLVGASQERQREDLSRFAERTAHVLAEATKRIRAGLGGELQRLEAAARSETAFEGETAVALRRQLEGMAERTGLVLDAVRGDIGGRLDASTAQIADLERRQREALETAARRQHEELTAFAERASGGLEMVTRRLREGLEETLAAHRGLPDRLAAVEEVLGAQHERLEAFTERAGEGLAEVSRRIQQGFQLILERSETALKTELEARLGAASERTGAVLEGVRSELGRRLDEAVRETNDRTIDLVTKVVGRQAGQQSKSLETITETLRSLLGSIEEAGREQSSAVERVLRASAARQEALLTEALSALRGAVEEVSAAYSSNGGSEAERAAGATAFTRRLRGVEQRLGQLSRELAGEAPPGGH